MKRIDRDPENEAIFETLTNDAVGRNGDVARFINLIQTIEGPYSIFLDAPWGEGKTFFVKSIEMVLRSRNPQTAESGIPSFKTLAGGFELDSTTYLYLPFYFNAWENDDYHDPLCPLLANMASEYNFDTKESQASFPEKAATIIDAISGIAGIASGNSGQPIMKNALDAFSGKDLLEHFKQRQLLRSKFDELIQDALLERADKMILFIDELDRCNPLFSIKLLEQTKRLFNNENVIIVFSVDSIQLAKAIGGVYGHEFDGKKYLERFFDMRFEPTSVDKLKYLNIMGYSASDNHHYAHIANDYISKSVFTMRDLNRICRRLRAGQQFIHSLSNSGPADYPFFFMKNALLPTFIVMSYTDPELWKTIRGGKGFEKILEFAADNSAFMKYLDLCLSESRMADENDKHASNARERYISRLCALIFIEDTQSDSHLDAYRAIGSYMWKCPDKKIFRLLEFPELT